VVQDIIHLGNTTSATVSGLTPGQTYYFVVTDCNTNGVESVPSNVISFDNGQADLVWENTVTGERSIWVMHDGVPASTIQLPTIATEWSIADAADFLGTGQADLVWQNTVTSERTIWNMRDAIPSSAVNLPTIPTEWQIVDQ